MINKKTINSALNALGNRVNFNQIQTAASDAITQLQSTQTTQLGSKVGERLGGFQALTQEIDDVVNNANEVVGGGIALLVDNPAGVKLVQDISSSNLSALGDLTGITVTSGLNQSIASAGTPEAVGASVSSASNKPLSEVSAAMESISPARLASTAASSVVKNLLGGGIGGGFTSTVSKTLGSVTSYLDKGMNQPLKDLIEVVDSPVKTAVINLTQSSGKIVPLTILKQVTGFVDQQRYKEAAGLLTPYSSLSTTEMETALSTINTTVSGSVSTTNAAFDELGASTAPTCIIGQYDTYWDGTNSSIKNPGAARGVAPGGQSTESGSYAFTYVSSLEELEAELRSATREITETVIHWTANYIDQAKVGADNIHQVHLQRGFSGCGYHYIIKRDGRIQRGRPINQVGAHAKDFGHNTYSIGISHVAGYNCVSGTPNPERYVSSDSISSAQWKAQKDFLTAFYRVFPGGQVLGHYQCTTSGKIDPGFDVNAYIKNTFNKTNALIYANNQPPLSRDELINTRGTTV